MKATIYIPYYGYIEDTNVNETVYKNDGDYEKALMEEYKRGDSIIDLFDGRVKDNMGSTYVFGQDTSVKEEKINFSPCEIELSPSDGEDANVIDILISAFAKDETTVQEMVLDFDSCDENFLTEISLWESEHEKIHALENKFGESWAWEKEPMRDLKLKFKNKKGEELIALLEGCKILDVIEKNNIIVFINKVMLVDEI